MFWTVASMAVILLLAAVVAVYVAYPHRDREVPWVPWVGEAMRRGVDLIPVQRDGEAMDRAVTATPRETSRPTASAGSN